MPQFLYQVRPTRLAMLTDGPTDQESRTVGEHFAYLSRLVDAGVLLMAGRTLNADASTFGIAVFVADSAEDAESIMRNDPAVQQGVMSAELYPYRVALWSRQGPPEES